MSKDKRLFARLDLDYADHPKIMMLSDAAFRAHITFLLYSRKYMTDGVINNRVANRVASQWDTDVLTELSTNDEANPSLVKLESGDWYLHGYENMQETRAEIESRTARNQANGRKGGRPRKPKETQSVTESGTPVAKPNVTQNKAETETETETDTPVGGKPEKPVSGFEIFVNDVTKEAYAAINKSMNYMGLRGIAKWCLKDRGVDAQRFCQTIVALYEMGKPVTRQTVGQYLDGHLTRQSGRKLTNAEVAMQELAGAGGQHELT